MKDPETLKLVGKLPTQIAISALVSRLKVKVTRLTNAETENLSYLPNEKAYELQNTACCHYIKMFLVFVQFPFCIVTFCIYGRMQILYVLFVYLNVPPSCAVPS